MLWLDTLSAQSEHVGVLRAYAGWGLVWGSFTRSVGRGCAWAARGVALDAARSGQVDGLAPGLSPDQLSGSASVMG